MRIKKGDKVAGQPILQIRDLFKEAGSDLFSTKAVMDKCGVSKQKALKIIREMEADGLIEPDPEKLNPGFYKTTSGGLRLANALMVKPIKRDKADKLFADFMKRVEEVNARDELAYYVEQVGLFGSYVDEKAEDFADIDIMVDMQQRLLPGRDIIKHTYERADLSGREFRSSFEMLAYGEEEVWRLLKARHPHLSLHSPGSLKVIGVTPKIVFTAGR